jgi:hypothetical protein
MTRWTVSYIVQSTVIADSHEEAMDRAEVLRDQSFTRKNQPGIPVRVYGWTVDQ